MGFALQGVDLPVRPENVILLAAAHLAAPAIAVPVAGLDWAYLLRAADRQGLTPLLHIWFEERADLAAPAAVLAALRAGYWSSHFRNSALRTALVEVLRAAAAHGVPVMPLKGALLSARYYSEAALRPMSDLDLLVPPDFAEQFAAVLRELGYRETSPAPALLAERLRDPRHLERAFTRQEQGLTILLEYRSEALDPVLWQLTGLDVPLSAALQRHAARMWTRGTADTLGGAPYTRISPEDLLLHVASHMATRHADLRLLWLHDLGRVLAADGARLDWDYLMQTARMLRLSAPVMVPLGAAVRWLGAPGLPSSAHLRFQPLLDRVEYRLLLGRQQGLPAADLAAPPPAEVVRKVLSLLRLRGLSARLRAVRWALVPGPEYLALWRGDDDVRAGRAYAAVVVQRLVTLLRRGTRAF
jgi:hypothetical protein